MTTINRLRVIGFVFCTVFAAGSAAADAIDGKWCFSDGRHLAIDGSKITTPAGTPTTGQYDRHAFIYTVPGHDPDAGEKIFMVLRDEDTVLLSARAWPGSTDAGATQVWFRCTGPTS